MNGIREEKKLSHNKRYLSEKKRKESEAIRRKKGQRKAKINGMRIVS